MHLQQTEDPKKIRSAAVQGRGMTIKGGEGPRASNAQDHARWMRLALGHAERALNDGEAPIGCVLLDKQGNVLSEGRNDMRATGNPVGHAEINAFCAAGAKISPQAGVVLVSTLEPCVMCTGAAMETGVTTIVFGLRAPADSGTSRVNPPSSPGSKAPEIIGGVLETESRALFLQWLTRHEGDASRADQRAFIEQLMALTQGFTPAALAPPTPVPAKKRSPAVPSSDRDRMQSNPNA